MKHFLLIIFSSIWLNNYSQEIKEINPTEARQGDKIELRISGKNTHFKQATNLTITLNKNIIQYLLPNSVDIQNDTLLIAKYNFTNSNPIGLYNLSINNEIDNSLTKFDAFTLKKDSIKPSIISATPQFVCKKQIIPLSISGSHTHFKLATNTVRLKNGSQLINALSVSVNNSDTLTARFEFNEFHNFDTFDLFLENEIDSELILSNALIHKNINPEISILPTQANLGEKIELTISGKNTIFKLATSTINISLSGIVPESQTIISDTIIKAIFDFRKKYTTGKYTLSILNYFGENVTNYNCFTLNPNPLVPYIKYISPDTCRSNSKIKLLISGNNTHFKQSTNTTISVVSENMVYGPAIQTSFWSDRFNFINDSLMEAEFMISNSAYIGKYKLNYYNNFDGTLLLNNAIEIKQAINPPFIKSISHSSAYKGDSLTITINCSGTSLKKYQNFQILPNPQKISIINDSVIKVFYLFTNSFQPRIYDFEIISKYDGYLKLINSFTLYDYINKPIISSFSPNSGYLGDTLNIRITGTNCHFLMYQTQITLNNQKGSVILPIKINKINNDTLISTFNLKGLLPEKYDLNISNLMDGGFNFDTAFTVKIKKNQPYIILITPDQYFPNGYNDTLDILIKALNTHFNLTNSKVWFTFQDHISDSVLSVKINVIDSNTLFAQFKNIFYHNCQRYNLCIYNPIDSLMSINECFMSCYINNEEINQENILICPNPVKDILTIKLYQSSEIYNQLSIINSVGTIVMNKSINTSIINEKIDMSEYPDGIYVVKINSQTHKIIKKSY